jgi:hypothetical protein
MKFRLALGLGLMSTTISLAQAYGVAMDPGNLGRLDFTTTMNSIQWANLEQNRERLSGKPAEDASTRFTASREGTGQARVLAGSYPAAGRADAEKAFNAMLQGYAKVEQHFGVPRHDLAGAVAAFFAGSYMAFNNADFPDAHFKPLVAQMRQTLASNPGFAQASDRDRQEMYEQMAIIGMFLAATQMALKQQPDPAVAQRLKQVGQGYLERFLKTDAVRVQIGAQGLTLQ